MYTYGFDIKIYLLFIFMHRCLPACMFVHHNAYLMLEEVRRGCWVP